MESTTGATTRMPFSSKPDQSLEKSTILSKRLRPTRLGTGLLSSKCQRVSVNTLSSKGDDSDGENSIQGKGEKDDETITFKPPSSSTRSTRQASRGISSSVNELLQTVAGDDDVIFPKDKKKGSQTAKCDESDDEATKTMTQNLDATVKIPVTAANRALTRAKASSSTATSDSSGKSVDAASAAPTSVVADISKPNLKRYIDDTLKSFDPNSRRQRTSGDLKNANVVQSTSRNPDTVSAASTAGTSSSVSSKPGLSGEDSDDNQETCKLDPDLSLCETKVIPKDAVEASVRRSSRRSSGGAKIAGNKTGDKDTASRRDSGSSAASCESSFEDPTTSAAAAGGGGRKKKPKKRVSFANSEEAAAPNASKPDGPLSRQQKKDAQADNDSNDSIVEMGKNSKSRSVSNKGIPVPVASTVVSTSTTFQDTDRQVVLNGRVYVKLGVLGKGGSSCVHRVLSLSDGQLYAYKRVDVRGSGEDSDAVFDSYVNEIDLLKRLKGSPYIIELIDAEVNREDMYIAMVMEAGEVDLSKVLTQKQKQSVATLTGTATAAAGGATSSSSSSGKSDAVGASEGNIELLNPFFARMIWQEMLAAVDHIHQHRIVHGDLKPANFVFVKGHLKLIDFGIAKAFSNDTTNIYRESQIGTVNYMAPEAIAPFSIEQDDKETHLKMKLGRASDIWSLGCILYQMIYGRPPFAALNTIQKLHAIPNPKYEIQYPTAGSGHAVDPDAIDTIKACLVRDPRVRAGITGERGLLNLPYLTLSGRQSSAPAAAAAVPAVVTKPAPVCRDATTQCEKTEENAKDGDLDKSIGDVSILAPIVPITEVRKAVDIVASALNGRGNATAAEKDELSRRIWRLLNREEGGDDAEAVPSATASASKAATLQRSSSAEASDEPSASQSRPRMNLSAVCAELQKKTVNRRVEATATSTGGATTAASSHSIVSTTLPPPPPGVRTTRHNTHATDGSSSTGSNKENVEQSKSSMNIASAVPRLPLGKGGVSFASAVADAAKKLQTRREQDSVNPAIASAATTSKSNTVAEVLPAREEAAVKRPALGALPLPMGFAEQIRQQQQLLMKNRTSAASSEKGNNAQDSDRAAKWMKPKGKSPEKQDLQSVLEKRLGEMRKFFDNEPDVTGTADFTDGLSFF